MVHGALEVAAGLSASERIDDLDGAGEQHRVPAQASGMAERGHQLAFAEAGFGDEHHVGVADARMRRCTRRSARAAASLTASSVRESRCDQCLSAAV